MEGMQKIDKCDINVSKEIDSKISLNKSNNNTVRENLNLSKNFDRTSNLDNSKIFKTNKKTFENLISESILKSQKRSFQQDNSNFKFVSNKKIPGRPLKINDQEYYKNFFMLTYQAIKLNSEDLEIFEEVPNRFYFIFLFF